MRLTTRITTAIPIGDHVYEMLSSDDVLAGRESIRTVPIRCRFTHRENPLFERVDLWAAFLVPLRNCFVRSTSVGCRSVASRLRIR